jgi:hypothetical protein
MFKQLMVDINEDEVVVESLTDTLGYIEDSIRRHTSQEDGEGSFVRSVRIFCKDPVEDLEKLKKFRKALKKVISWYTP